MELKDRERGVEMRWYQLAGTQIVFAITAIVLFVLLSITGASLFNAANTISCIAGFALFICSMVAYSAFTVQQVKWFKKWRTNEPSK